MKAVKRIVKKVVSDPDRRHICAACKQSFQYNCLLKYHIRSQHFNCVGLAPYAETKNINDVWIEKVENMDVFVEIKKVGTNELLIQKVKDGAILPTAIKRESIDVRKKYPLRIGGLVQCRVCKKSFVKKKLSKHFAAQHAKLVKKRCETCDISFKRLYNCAVHICV